MKALAFLCSRPLGLLFLLCLCLHAEPVWQWSVPVDQGRAFLWIAPDCTRVCAVIVGQHNMSEEGILENEAFRREMGRLGIALIWVTPPFDGPFDFTKDAGQRFEAFMSALAQESGYSELTFAPVIPIGHSACATYPWNFAAWNPGRTLAVLSVHGDAPQTDMTGYGRANIPWRARNIDGVPGLMVMAEYEWLEGRLTPALDYRARHPAAPIAMLAEPGRGHFDVSDDLIAFLCLFIRKASEQRLPAEMPLDRPPVLKPIDPAKGWLVQRWHPDKRRSVAPARWAEYAGDPTEAFWAFDEESALAVHNYRDGQYGKRPQLLGWQQGGKTRPQSNSHNQVTLHFEPLADGVSFQLRGVFLDSVDGGSPNTTRWTGLPPDSPIGHAGAGGPIQLSRITGPVAQISPDTFRIQLNRMASTVDRRNNDIWLLASHPGDEAFKSAVQQALMKVPRIGDGTEQRITFPAIPYQKIGVEKVVLAARSDSGLPVGYYVREGPAVVEGSLLRMLPVPPRAKLPIKITVVAWQRGRSAEPRINAADLVECSFLLGK